MLLVLIDRRETVDRDAIADAVGDGPVRVLVERRSRERRGPGDRRAAAAVDGMRRTRNRGGRRVLDRRGTQTLVELALPGAARCVEATPLAPIALEDADSARLVLRLQAGDRDALAALYVRYFDKVYSYVRMALHDDHEAEDATQDVFASALRALPQFEVGPGGCVRGWMFRVARNQVLDRVRRRRAVLVDPDDLARTLAAATDTAAPVGFTDDRLLAHVRRLPHAQREILVLRYALDFATDDIAAMTGKTPAAIRQLHQRAMRTLRASGRDLEAGRVAA